MAVVSNISVLLTAKTEQYKSGLAIARLSSDQLGKAVKSTGLSVRQLTTILDQTRQAVFKALTPFQQLRNEQQAMSFLHEKGALDAKGYAVAMDNLAKQYRQVASDAQKSSAAEKEAIAARQRASQLRSGATSPQQRRDDRTKELLDLRRRGLLTLAEGKKIFSQIKADFEKESGVSAQRIQDQKDFEREQEQINEMTSRNLSARARFALRRREILNLLKAGLDRTTAGRELRQARKELQDELGITKQHADAVRERQKLQDEIKKLNDAAQTPRQRRSASIEKLREQRAAGGLTPEAVRSQVQAIRDRFREESGLNDRIKEQTKVRDALNEQVQRGINLARPEMETLQRLKNELLDLRAALQAGKISQQEFNRERAKISESRRVAQADPAVTRGVEAARPFQQLVDANINRIRDLKAAVDAGKISQKEYNQVLTQGLGPQQQFNRAIAAYRSELKAGRISQREFAAVVRQTKTEILGQASAFSALLKPLGIIRSVIIGLTAAKLFGGISSAFSQAFEFDTQIRRSVALFEDATKAQKKALREAVVNATSNPFDLVERAKVLEELARDGVDAETALRTLNKTLRFAFVSATSPTESVGLVSEVLNAYRLRTGDVREDTIRLSQVMDLLTVSANQTASSTVEMAQALIRVAPEANKLNIGIRDAARGAIALSELGRKGEVGGSELAIALRDITNKAAENKEAFAALGIQVFDANGDFVSMGLTIKSLAKAMRQASPEQRTQILNYLGMQQKSQQFTQQLVSLVDVMDTFRVEVKDANDAVDKLNEESLKKTAELFNIISSTLSELVNVTITGPFEMLAGQLLKINSETVKFVAQVGAFVAGFFAGVAAVRLMIAAWTAYRKAVQGVTIAQAILLGLQGPKGWAQLAGGAIFATAAVVALRTAFSAMEDEAPDEMAEEMAETKKLVEESAEAMDHLKNATKAAGQEISNLSNTQVGDVKVAGGAPEFAAQAEIAAASVQQRLESVRKLATNFDQVAGKFTSFGQDITPLLIGTSFLEDKILAIKKAMEASGENVLLPGVSAELDKLVQQADQMAQSILQTGEPPPGMESLLASLENLQGQLDQGGESLRTLAGDAAAAGDGITNALNPDIEAGVAAARPWQKMVTEQLDRFRQLKAALDAQKITQKEYQDAVKNSDDKQLKLNEAIAAYRRELDAGKISQDEFNAAVSAAKTEILGKDQTKAIDDLKDKLKDLQSQTQTPVEKLQEQLLDLKALGESGIGLDERTRQRAISKFLTDYRDAIGKVKEETKAANVESTTITSQADFASRFTVKPAAAATEAQLGRQQVDLLIKQNATLDSILTELQNRGVRQAPKPVEAEQITIPGG